MLPPPTMLTWRSWSSGSMPISERIADARVEDAIARHRSGGFVEPDDAFTRLRCRKRGGFDLDQTADVVRDSKAEGLPDLAGLSRAHRRVRDEPAGLHDEPHVRLRDRNRGRLPGSGVLLIALAIERVTVSVGNDLHRLAALDRIRSYRLRNPPLQFCAQALRRAHDDFPNLRFGERFEIHLRAARTDRCIDLARARASSRRSKRSRPARLRRKVS